MRRRRIHCALMAGATLALAAPAVGVPPEWTPSAVQTMTSVGDFDVVDVAVGRGGAATVGVTRITPEGVVPGVLERSARGPRWRRPTALGGATRIDFGPIVARNRRGDAVAVWAKVNGPVMAAVRFGKRWSRPVSVGTTLPSANGEDASSVLRTAMGPDRRARVAVRTCGRTGCRVDLLRLRRPATAVWERVGRLSTPRGSGASFDWALGQDGDLLVAWRQGRRVLALYVPASAKLVPARPRRLPVGDARGRVTADVVGRGTAAVGWSTLKGAAGTSVRLGGESNWRAARRTFRPAGASDPRVAVGCAGGVYLSWSEKGRVVRAATAAGTEGLFAPPFEVRTYGDETKPVSVWDVAVLGRSGFGMTIWRRADDAGAGAVGSLLGNRSQNPGRGQGFSGEYRQGPRPAFNDDGQGLLVRLADDGVHFQEYVPGETVLRCA
ncbi:MAG: hypothetical protein R2878_06830 [Thermoleophilia bacterium]